MARYRLYLDESGDHAVRGVRPSDGDKRHLVLFGCALNLDYCHSAFLPALEAFKQSHFGNDLDDPVILHLEDVHGKSGQFKPLAAKDKCDEFWRDFYDLARHCNFVCFSVLIDKLIDAIEALRAMFLPTLITLVCSQCWRGIVDS